MAKLLEQAQALHNQGQLQTAVQLYRQVLADEPDHLQVLRLLGVALRALKQPQQALQSYDHALALKPDFVEVLFNKGNLLQELGQHSAAIACYDQAIAYQADYAQAYCNRGSSLVQLDQLPAALASYQRAIALKPAFVQAYNNQGAVLERLKQYEAAIRSYDQAIALQPDYADAYCNRGNALRLLGQHENALQSYDCALAVQADNVQAYCGKGIVLWAQQKYQAALDNYDQALALQPRHVQAHLNRGIALADLQQIPAAIASYRQAIALEPNCADAHLNLSLILLRQGDFEQGFKEYEWRWQNEQLRRITRSFGQPLWLGQTSLNGKTILLHSEQGFGDTLQFCRYASQIKSLGACVLFQVHPPLKTLLQGLAGVDQLLTEGQTWPAFDYHCPVASLPLALHTTPSTIPTVSKLRVDAAIAAHWHQRLGPKTRPRVGLAWAGNPQHSNDRNRSIALAQLLSVVSAASAQIEFFSLQKELRAGDAQLLAQQPQIKALGQELTDFADTAAIMEQLDLVISVDTSLVHLAGTLSQKVWVLLPFLADWRWLQSRVDSPWYPGMRLYRQPQAGNWASVLASVTQDLLTLSS